MSYAVNQENGIPILTWHYDKTDSELLKLIPLLEYLSYVDDVRDFIVKGVSNNVVNFDYANEIINKANDISKTININSNSNNDNINYHQSNNNQLYYSQSQLHPQAQVQYGLVTNQENKAVNKSSSNIATINNYVELTNTSNQKWRTTTPGPFNLRKKQSDEEKTEAIDNQQQTRDLNIKRDVSPNRMLSYTPKMNYRNSSNSDNVNSTQSYTGYYNNRKGIRNEFDPDYALRENNIQPNISPNININIVNHNISNYPIDQLNKKYETIEKGKESFNPFVPPKYKNKIDYIPDMVIKQQKDKTEDDDDESSVTLSMDENMIQNNNTKLGLQNKTISTSNINPYFTGQYKNQYQYYSQPNNNSQTHTNSSNNSNDTDTFSNQTPTISQSPSLMMNQFKKITNYENENSRNYTSSINHSYTANTHTDKQNEANHNYYSNPQDKYTYNNNPNANSNQNPNEQFHYRPYNPQREKQNEYHYSNYTVNQLKQEESYSTDINMRDYTPSFVPSSSSPKLPLYQNKLFPSYHQHQQDFEYEQRSVPYPLYKNQSIIPNTNYQQQMLETNLKDVYRQHQYDYQTNPYRNENIPLASRSINTIQQSNINIMDNQNHIQQPQYLNHPKSIQSINRDYREINPNYNQVDHNYYNQPSRDYIPYKRGYTNNYLGYDNSNSTSTYYDQIRDSYY